MYLEVDYFRRPYGLFLFLLFVPYSEHTLYKTIKRVFQTSDSLIRLTVLHHPGNIVLNVHHWLSLVVFISLLMSKYDGCVLLPCTL